MHGQPGQRLLTDRGSVVVESVLVGVLLTGLLLGVLQVALVLHVRNVVAASAAEGAREAGLADRGCEAGAALARDLVARALSDRVAGGFGIECEPVAGEPATVRVRVHGAVPLLLVPAAAVPIDVTVQAVEEAP